MARRKIEFLLTAKNKTAQAFGRAKKGLDDISAKAAAFARSVGIGLGAFTGGVGAAAISAIKKHADEIDNLGKKAGALGIKTEELSKLSYAAELAGSSITGITDALEKMLNRVSKAAEGTGEAKDAIAELGLDAAELEKLAPEEQFKELADAIASVGTAADQVRLKRAIFGRGDSNVLNLLKQTSIGIEESARQLENLDGVITDADGDAAAKFADNIYKLGASIDALVRAGTGPAIEKINSIFVALGIDAAPAVDKLDRNIANLQQHLENFERMAAGQGDGVVERFLGAVTSDEELQRVIGLVRTRLDELQKIKDDFSAKDAELEKKQASLKAAADHNKKMAAIRKADAEALKGTLAAKEKAFQSHNAALQAHRNEQKGLFEEIKSTIEEIRNFGKDQPDATPYDYLSKAADAQNLIDAGDFAGAMAAIREAMTLFQQYQEAGKASSADVILMTKSFEELAKAAQAAQGSKLEEAAVRAAAAHQDLKDEIEGKPIKAPVEAAKDSGKKIWIGAQNQVQAEGPIKVAVELGLSWGATVPGVATQGDVQQQDVQSESLKRGYRI